MRGNALQLALGTGAFGVCFAVFGSVSALMPLLRQRLSLTPLQVSVALAVPVLLGSVGRIPLGLWADRFGGRRVFSLVLLAALLPAVALGFVSSYAQLLFIGFFLGVALASFSVGVSFVSRWYPPERQGAALGLYGMGSGGQALAAFGAPRVARALSLRWGFWCFAALLACWLLLFLLLARDAPTQARARSLREALEPLRALRSRVLSAYYFLTFGCFVAMALSLPTLLTELFALTPQEAGLRTACFVLVAIALRPVGGALADRVGGRRVLCAVFPAIAVAACALMAPGLPLFTAATLALAVALGLGNGAVLKLVPQYFPGAVGSVTGLVGAAGGLGGFFPPLVLGALKRSTGSYAPGFALLALAAAGALVLVLRVRDADA